MGAAPGMIIPVEIETVRKVVGEDFNKLEELLERIDSSIEELAKGIEMDDLGICIGPNGEDVEVEEIENILYQVTKKFEEKNRYSHRDCLYRPRTLR